VGNELQNIGKAFEDTVTVPHVSSALSLFFWVVAEGKWTYLPITIHYLRLIRERGGL
jgi:hypothetical protein